MLQLAYNGSHLFVTVSMLIINVCWLLPAAWLAQRYPSFAVWILGPDAEFEILAPAFDATQTWTDPADGSGAALVGVSTATSNQGMLVPYSASTTISAPVARLLKVNSSTKLTIGGLNAYDAAELTAGRN